jgi:hypothetical protein
VYSQRGSASHSSLHVGPHFAPPGAGSEPFFLHLWGSGPSLNLSPNVSYTPGTTGTSPLGALDPSCYYPSLAGVSADAPALRSDPANARACAAWKGEKSMPHYKLAQID